MSRTTARRRRPNDVRAVLAALAIAAAAAAPVPAFVEAAHPAKTTISADPNDGDNFDYTGITGDGGGGGG